LLKYTLDSGGRRHPGTGPGKVARELLAWRGGFRLPAVFRRFPAKVVTLLKVTTFPLARPPFQHGGAGNNGLPAPKRDPTALLGSVRFYEVLLGALSYPIGFYHFWEVGSIEFYQPSSELTRSS
jgi:hypothetical protein